MSVTLDPTKLARARELVDAKSTSDVLDQSLDRLIEDELDRIHAAGYRRVPPTRDELAFAEAARDPAAIADDTDWAALYGVE